MNEQEIEIINSLTRTQKIKNFTKKNIKFIILIIIVILLSIFGFFVLKEINDRKKVEISNLYKNSIINFSDTNKAQVIKNLTGIIKKKDETYSPLALYFLIENNLITSKKEINLYFDIIINELKLNKTIKNLNIYKKALYNSDSSSEEEILNIINPLIKEDNIWRSHSLYLIGEYYYSKNQKQKSKEFFEKIISINNSNPDIKLEAQKRLQRDFSE